MAELTDKAKKIKRKYEKDWMAVEGVIGVGVGIIDSQAGIIISVDRDPRKIRKYIPQTIDTVTIDIRRSEPYKTQ